MAFLEADDQEYKNVLQLVKSLELIDSLVVEAAQDALWYQERHADSINLSVSKEDLERLQGSHDVYQDSYLMDDMLQYLAELYINQRLLDALIAVLIKLMVRTTVSDRGQWLDWYERMQKAGDASWRRAVPASSSFGSADMINALTDKYASIDRVLDILKSYLFVGRERPSFSDEHRDTLLALISISQARGQDTIPTVDEINAMKSEIRRRRTTEGSQRNLVSASAAQPHEQFSAELQLETFVPLSASATTQQTLTSRLSSFFPKGQSCNEPYTDSGINAISALLKHSHPQWCEVPRTYVVLRVIGHLDLLDKLIDVGFSDYWFPVTERTLPDCLLPSIKALFVRTQSLVLTKSMDLEKGEKGHHCYYKQGESPPFETKGILGRGGFGQVDRVLSLISFKEYARKQVPRGLAFRGRQKEDIKRFIAEIEILKRLKHHHIVEFVGSYTDPKCISLIMSPVAEMDLAAYLKRANESNLPELRTFFGCLATALEFLHEQNVRHKDIKPGNILANCGRVLFADFGLSLDFTDANSSTTMSLVNGITPRYCAPEVALQGPRNTMSDIWSLGAVFMEMIAVLKGKTAQYIDEFYKQHGSWQTFVCTSPAALEEFVAELERTGELSDNRALDWTQQMLSPKQQLRPTASSLVASITSPSQEGELTGFCGICCISSDKEDLSD
ncbi:kinase-like domain-containing protein [Paraphoma chrysanthemicola]|uniref:Kinase-like domain-containing protein n=1 Tax=Paraphoma chrysanthemicola TaxID=798071 RepID=A0A8K0VVV7_9PLEO|nr:kinase-like domain-containing protein [Paraphoma chrysanthemicola]